MKIAGLNDVDWNKYQGAHGLGEKLPEYIENLLSEDLEVRQQAQSTVREEITHQLSVYPVTPFVVKILVGLLSHPDHSDTFWLLDILNSVTSNCSYTLLYGNLSINNSYLRQCFETHNHITQGYQVYVLNIQHPMAEVRASAVRILARISEHNSTIRAKFKQILMTENDPVVRSIALLHISNLLPRSYRHRMRKLKQHYSDLIITYVSDKYDRLTQLIAAQSWQKIQEVHVYDGPKSVPDEIFQIYFDTLTNRIDLQKYPSHMNHREFELWDCLQPHLIFEKISLLGLDRTVPYLFLDSLSVEQVHYLGRELMERAFNRRSTSISEKENVSFRKWKHFNGWIDNSSPFNLAYSNAEQSSNTMQSSPDKIEYRIAATKRDYISGKPLAKWQKPVIRALVDCDKFWVIESNLFSFFYGLPDEREQLRKLLD